MDDFETRLERAATALGFLTAEVPSASARSVESVVQFLVGHLIANELLSPEEAGAAVDVVLKRERLGSTAIERGLAFPHASCLSGSRVLGVLARSRTALSWESLDGQPVHLICLMLAPVNRPQDLIHAVQSLNDALRPSGH